MFAKVKYFLLYFSHCPGAAHTVPEGAAAAIAVTVVVAAAVWWWGNPPSQLTRSSPHFQPPYCLAIPWQSHPYPSAPPYTCHQPHLYPTLPLPHLQPCPISPHLCHTLSRTPPPPLPPPTSWLNFSTQVPTLHKTPHIGKRLWLTQWWSLMRHLSYWWLLSCNTNPWLLHMATRGSFVWGEKMEGCWFLQTLSTENRSPLSSWEVIINFGKLHGNRIMES